MNSAIETLTQALQKQRIILTDLELAADACAAAMISLEARIDESKKSVAEFTEALKKLG